MRATGQRRSRSSRYADNSDNSDYSSGRVLAAHCRDRLIQNGKARLRARRQHEMGRKGVLTPRGNWCITGARNWDPGTIQSQFGTFETPPAKYYEIGRA